MKRTSGLLAAALIIFVFSLPAHATLILRGTGTSAYGTYNLIYDNDLNITWYDYTKTPKYKWQNQVNWADALTVDFNGTIYDDWRLPSTVDGALVYGYQGPNPDGSYSYTYGYNLYNSELGHLFYTELGNLGYVATDGTQPQPGWGLTNTGPFNNLQPVSYWSGTEYAPNTTYAWNFRFSDGKQYTDPKGYYHYALAVRPGDVSAAVPEPATLLLLGSGLAGLAVLRKRLGCREG